MKPKLRQIALCCALALGMIVWQVWRLRPPSYLAGQTYIVTSPRGGKIYKGSPDSHYGLAKNAFPTSLLQNTGEEMGQYVYTVRLFGYQDQVVLIPPERRGQVVSVDLKPTNPLVPLLYLMRDALPALLALLILGLSYRYHLLPYLRWRRRQSTLQGLDTIEPGLVLDGYRTEHEIGRGGMSRVFLARRVDNESEPLALKVLHPRLLENPEAVQQFRKEIQISMTLSHPNIVHLLDWGEAHGFVYLVSEFVEGRMLKGAGPAPLASVCEWGCQIVGALRYAHRQGIVHRDIKPANLMLDHHDHLFVTDFGIAATANGGATERSGTIGFAPPEQLEGDVSPASDYYALGVTLYTLIQGEGPFAGDDFVQVLAAQQQGRYRPLGEEVPAPMVELVDSLLNNDPKQRLGDPDRVLQLLNACRASLTSSAEE